MITLTNIFFRTFALVALSFALISCNTLLSTLHLTHHAHAGSARTHYRAEAYVKHLTLARLTLATAADDKAAAHDLDIIDAYAAQKSSKPEQQMLAVFEYKNNGTGTMRTIVAPLVLSGKNQLSALLEIMHRLDDDYTLYNIRLSMAVIAPSEDLALPEDDVDEIKQALDQQQQHLLDNAETLPVLDDARAQLQLARFFMDHHFRDAAYLSIENVKRELASASQGNSADTNTVKELSQELETTEIRLHKEMPFTFLHNN